MCATRSLRVLMGSSGGVAAFAFSIALEQLGYQVVAVCRRVDDLLSMAVPGTVDVALLDAFIEGWWTTSSAAALRSAGVPVVLVVDPDRPLPPGLDGLPTVAQPLLLSEVAAQLEKSARPQ